MDGKVLALFKLQVTIWRLRNPQCGGSTVLTSGYADELWSLRGKSGINVSHPECGVSGGCQPGVQGKNVTPPQGCFLVFVLSMFPLNRTFQKFPAEYISFKFLLYRFRFSSLLSHSSFVWILIHYSLHDSFIRRVFGGMLSGTVWSIWRALDEERPSPFFCTSKLAG